MKKLWALPKPIARVAPVKGHGPLKSILWNASGGMGPKNRKAQSPRKIIAGAIILALMGAGVLWLRGHVKLVWNETESLPQHLFWVRTDQKPRRGDYVLFEPPKDVNSHYAFIKHVAGVAGDTVAVQGEIVFVAGEKIGTAKTISRKGKPLHTTPAGEIPPGFYFVHTDHRDSYDSRYQSIGLVPDARIIGRATPLF